MNRRIAQRLFIAALAGSLLASCGGDDEQATTPPAGAPGPGSGSPSPPPPPPPPASTLPAQLPTTFSWTSATSLLGAVQLMRSGATGSAEGQTYTFAADSAGRITVSGGAVVSTMSSIADQGAVLQLCRIAGTSGGLAVLVDAALPAVSAADLNGKTFDEAECQSASGDFRASRSFWRVDSGATAGTARFFENATTEVGDEQTAVMLSAAGSTKYQADIGTLRWRALRRPNGMIVIVESNSGGILTPPTNGEPAGVSLYLQRP